MVNLFENNARTDMDYAKENENPYNFYDRIAIPKFVIVRDLMNEWFSEFPNGEKVELKQRFKI